MSKMEFLTGVNESHPGLLSLEAIWESLLEDHCGEDHIPIGLSLNIERSLFTILDLYKFICVYPSCIPSVVGVLPNWQGDDKKIISVLFEHKSSGRRGSLACVVNSNVLCTQYQRYVCDLITNK